MLTTLGQLRDARLYTKIISLIEDECFQSWESGDGKTPF